MMMQKLSRQLLQRTVYSFSGGYFSHRTTTDNNDSTPFDFTPQNYQEVQKILAKYPSNWRRSAIIPLLTLAQKQNDNFLSLAAMRKVARITEVN
jgi:NADH dehydrogenase (ubiquinone) flavoprotein 2